MTAERGIAVDGIVTLAVVGRKSAFHRLLSKRGRILAAKRKLLP